MNNVPIEKIHDFEEFSLPILEEMQKTFDVVRQKAFDLFQQRGRSRRGSGRLVPRGARIARAVAI